MNIISTFKIIFLLGSLSACLVRETTSVDLGTHYLDLDETVRPKTHLLKRQIEKQNGEVNVTILGAKSQDRNDLSSFLRQAGFRNVKSQKVQTGYHLIEAGGDFANSRVTWNIHVLNGDRLDYIGFSESEFTRNEETRGLFNILNRLFSKKKDKPIDRKDTNLREDILTTLKKSQVIIDMSLHAELAHDLLTIYSKAMQANRYHVVALLTCDKEQKERFFERAAEEKNLKLDIATFDSLNYQKLLIPQLVNLLVGLALDLPWPQILAHWDQPESTTRTYPQFKSIDETARASTRR